MNGLELARGFYETYGKPMLENEFPDLLGHLAVGFVGRGSEHFGFDDDVSRDHDFEPGFMVFLPSEDIVSRREAFLLERAYAKLPKEYGGVCRLPVSPVGGHRNGIFRTADFYTDAVGSPDGDLSAEAWLSLPSYALAEATNGEVFFDGCGEFTRIRASLLTMPEDVRLKRLAGQLLLMAQSGQYNFARCLSHGETEAAQLACNEFVNAAAEAFFLLNRSYKPFYKWTFRALRALDASDDVTSSLSFLLSGDNREEAVSRRKSETIEALSAFFIASLRREGLSDSRSDALEAHAYAVNDRIGDGNIRNLHILAAV